ncbi:transposase [Chryseobacterium sp. PS-8]|uniref:Transposase n=1 Tax=Chryseobacterium indicum TaxID=2766954 RepID=A0ABS9C6V4_9FLAO|nr:transposase [Chryseobacterium sp. PS-8]
MFHTLSINNALNPSIHRLIINHYSNILNYFEARITNAAAESFNAKIKNLRLQLRGVKNKAFFLFRLTKLFA